MNYVEELTQQLVSLRDQKYIKINIHYQIPEPLYSFCIKMNKDMNDHAVGFISFGYNSIIFPHLSVYMGYINSFNQLESVFHYLSDYAINTLPFKLSPSELYFKGVSKTAPQYLFLETQQTDYLLSQKNMFFSTLDQEIKPLEWDVQHEVPHISIGCYKGVSDAMIKSLSKYSTIPDCTISEIGLSLSGSRGVCLGTLKSFALKST